MSTGTSALHRDCIMCLANRESGMTRGEVVGAALRMFYHDGHSIEDIVRNLCFEHRRLVQLENP